jgi:hypothetical protein
MKDEAYALRQREANFVVESYARGDTHLESWPSGLNDGVHLTFRWIPWKTQNLSCDAGTAQP